MKFPENINVLPQPSFISALYERHYLSERESRASSSHWKKQAEGFAVEIEPDGSIKSLYGSGFGDYITPKLKNKLAGYFTILTYLLVLPNQVKILRQLSKAWALGLPFTYDTFRQCAIASLLADRLAGNPEPVIALIGDGHGVLSSMMKANFPKARITLFDLGKLLLFQNVYLQSKFPECSFFLADQESAGRVGKSDFSFVEAERVQELTLPEGKFDLFINVASMQEMTMSWITYYFGMIRRMLRPGGGLLLLQSPPQGARRRGSAQFRPVSLGAER